jgi:hypothetical protein
VISSAFECVCAPQAHPAIVLYGTLVEMANPRPDATGRPQTAPREDDAIDPEVEAKPKRRKQPRRRPRARALEPREREAVREVLYAARFADRLAVFHANC